MEVESGRIPELKVEVENGGGERAHTRIEGGGGEWNINLHEQRDPVLCARAQAPRPSNLASTA